MIDCCLRRRERRARDEDADYVYVNKSSLFVDPMHFPTNIDLVLIPHEPCYLSNRGLPCPGKSELMGEAIMNGEVDLDSIVGLTPLFTGPAITAYALNSTVFVLRMETFGLPTDEDNMEFLQVINNTVNLGKSKNVPNLIIDLRDNTGGSICLGFQAVAALMEESWPLGKKDIRQTSYMTHLFEVFAEPQYKGYILSPEMFVNPTTHEPFTDLSFLLPGVNHTRNGFNSMYSDLFEDYCTFEYPVSRYTFPNTLVLTNGFCGSTCAVVSSNLGEKEEVTTVVIGGFVGEELQQYFSFPGGEVATLTALYWLAGMVHYNGTDLPPPLITGAELTFAFEEIYSWSPSDDPNIPLEFLFKPADYHYAQWDFENLADLYTQVANFL